MTETKITRINSIKKTISELDRINPDKAEELLNLALSNNTLYGMKYAKEKTNDRLQATSRTCYINKIISILKMLPKEEKYTLEAITYINDPKTSDSDKCKLYRALAKDATNELQMEYYKKSYELSKENSDLCSYGRACEKAKHLAEAENAYLNTMPYSAPELVKLYSRPEFSDKKNQLFEIVLEGAKYGYSDLVSLLYSKPSFKNKLEKLYVGRKELMYEYKKFNASLKLELINEAHKREYVTRPFLSSFCKVNGISYNLANNYLSSLCIEVLEDDYEEDIPILSKLAFVISTHESFVNEDIHLDFASENIAYGPLSRLIERYKLSYDLLEFYIDGYTEKQGLAHDASECALFLEIPYEESVRKHERLIMMLEDSEAKQSIETSYISYKRLLSEGHL